MIEEWCRYENQPVSQACEILQSVFHFITNLVGKVIEISEEVFVMLLTREYWKEPLSYNTYHGVDSFLRLYCHSSVTKHVMDL